MTDHPNFRRLLDAKRIEQQTYHCVSATYQAPELFQRCLGTWRLAYRNVNKVVEETAQREARGILNPWRW